MCGSLSDFSSYGCSLALLVGFFRRHGEIVVSMLLVLSASLLFMLAHFLQVNGIALTQLLQLTSEDWILHFVWVTDLNTSTTTDLPLTHTRTFSLALFSLGAAAFFSAAPIVNFLAGKRMHETFAMWQPFKGKKIPSACNNPLF